MLQELLKILACPKCHGDLASEQNELVCPHCRLAFSIDDEIPILLIEKARRLN